MTIHTMVLYTKESTLLQMLKMLTKNEQTYLIDRFLSNAKRINQTVDDDSVVAYVGTNLSIDEPFFMQSMSSVRDYFDSNDFVITYELAEDEDTPALMTSIGKMQIPRNVIQIINDVIDEEVPFLTSTIELILLPDNNTRIEVVPSEKKKQLVFKITDKEDGTETARFSLGISQVEELREQLKDFIKRFDKK